MRDFQSWLSQRLEGAGGEHRVLRRVTNHGPRTIEVEGRSLLNLSGNDYLSLSQQDFDSGPLVSQPSSRLMGGNSMDVQNLESSLAQAMGREAALFYPSGYTANVGVMGSLPEEGDVVLLDRLCHASLIDGVRLGAARFERFRHLDMNHLERLLIKHEGRTRWVMTESLFSMDGDLVPVERLLELKARHPFHLVVDEAHSMGVYGPKGHGWFAHHQALEAVDVLIFNFSKSLALQGGCVMGPSLLVDFLVRRSRPFIYTTATPASHLRGLRERWSALEKADVLREQLKQLSRELASRLELNRAWSPIVPILIGPGEKALEVAAGLESAGILCPAILPPTVPEGKARLRVSLNASHRREDLERLLEALEGQGITPGKN